MINWTEGDELTRFSVEVGVAYGSNTELVKQILTDVVTEHQAVSNHRPVQVQFRDFGDSSLNFKVLFWAENTWEIEFLRSTIRFEIDKQFRINGVTIPFPQRDVHMYPTDK